MLKKANRIQLVLIILCLVMGISLHNVKAHFQTIGYSDISIEKDRILYSLFLDPYQVIDEIEKLDADEDMYIVDSEVKQALSQLEEYVDTYLTVKGNGEVGKYVFNSATLEDRGNIPMIHLSMTYQFTQPIKDYEIAYHFFFENSDPGHRNFTTIVENGQNREVILDKENNLIGGEIGSNYKVMIDFQSYLTSTNLFILCCILSFIALGWIFRKRLGRLYYRVHSRR